MADQFQLRLGDGAPGAPGLTDDLVAVEVEENADLPGAVQLTLRVCVEGPPGAEDLTWVGDARLGPYARIAVIATPDGGKPACIFDGYVLSHKLHVDPGTTAAELRVWGQDVTCLMNLEQVVKPWTQSDAAIANAIFDDHGITPATGNLPDDAPEHPEDVRPLMQRATDAEFLRDRARRNGKLFRVCCGETAGKNTGYFQKPDLAGAAVATLVLNPPGEANVDALDLAWDVARPTEVLADVLLAAKEPDAGGATESGLDKLDQRELAAFAGADHAMQARLTAVTDSVAELKLRSAALLREAAWFVTCEGETDLARLGHVLRVATVVQVNGAGRMHSGKYFVWSVRHTITAAGHRMRFVLVRNAVGRA